MMDLPPNTSAALQALRPPSVVMALERLGSLHSSRLSFARSLMRQMARQRWHITCERFALNAQGHGEAVYRIQTPNGRYHAVIFSRALADELRSDRVIANAWDITFGLVEGDVEESLMASLTENLPLQEAGRQHPSLLVISRANKSERNFEQFVDALVNGHQPDSKLLLDAGYLYRTTAVYGNGKFGIADYGRLQNNPDFKRPFSAQMTVVYLLRHFAVAQVEHIARCRAPEKAVALNTELQRYMGIGNSTGLGMAPFLINHPQLIDRWITAREQALALCKLQTPTELNRQRLLTLCTRARQYFVETKVDDDQQQYLNDVVVTELDSVLPWLEQVELTDTLWQELCDWAEAALSVESQELLHSLLLELYPTLVDSLEDAMSVQEKQELHPDMPLIQLKQLIETHFDWALAENFDEPQSSYWFWYRSVEKEEPRLGVRGQDPGVEKELALAVAPRVQRCHSAIEAFLIDNPRVLTIEFLMANPKFMDTVRRIQTMAATSYGEIRANLWHRDMKPMHLLRTKLSFLGASRFDPRSDRWVRVTFFQGAPLVDELNREPTDLASFDDWSFPLAPVLRETTATGTIRDTIDTNTNHTNTSTHIQTDTNTDTDTDTDSITCAEEHDESLL